MTATLIVFLVICGIGVLFLMISLLIGDLFEAFDLDLDFDGDGGDGYGFLNTRVISVFLTAFGGIAALAILYNYSLLLSIFAGIGSGLIFGALVFAFGYLLHSQQSSSSVSERDLIGRTAKVVVSIGDGSIGQISCKIGEERIEKLARSRDGSEIALGETVFIEEITPDAYVVSPMESYSLTDD